MGKKPHIIIFNPDEMRGDAALSKAGIMPFYDRLARTEAVAFLRAYCQNPHCVPSRCSYFTGLYPHVNGHRTMSYLLHPGETTLFQELRQNGYYVWMNDRNDLTAGQIPGWTESQADEIFYGEDGTPAPGPKLLNRRGEAGGKYYYSHFGGELKVDEKGRNYTSDDRAVDAAIDRILHPVDDRPMCLFLGLIYPHTPYQVEEPYYSAIDTKGLPPRVKAQECQGRPKIEAIARRYAGMGEFTEEDWEELRQVYYGMCRKVDDQFRRLVDALKTAGIYDDSAIFYFSDHGDYTGDYGLVEKSKSSFPECLSRVPFLIKPPKGVEVTPGVSDGLVELVDFYATALDFAGISSSHPHFGRSLRPQLSDPKARVRDYAFCEGGRMPDELHGEAYLMDKYGSTLASQIEYWPKRMSEMDDEAASRATMIVSDRYKYISRVSGENEFYDLEEDPHEKTNLYGREAVMPQILSMQTAMLHWLQATSDIVPYELDQRFTPKMIFSRLKHTVPEQYWPQVECKIQEGMPFAELMQYCKQLRNG